MPAYVTGIQQAWGFAWKALMAGELIVPAVGASGLGHLLDNTQDVAEILAVVAVIAVIGVAVDYLIVGAIDRRVRAKRGCSSPPDPQTPPTVCSPYRSISASMSSARIRARPSSVSGVWSSFGTIQHTSNSRPSGSRP